MCIKMSVFKAGKGTKIKKKTYDFVSNPTHGYLIAV